MTAAHPATVESDRHAVDGDRHAVESDRHAVDGDQHGGDMRRRLAELRDSFDRSFADPHREEVAGFDDLLAIRVGGQRYALRLTQAAGLFPDRPVTRLPGPLAALLGVASFRGSIVPVYDLGAVFGHPAAAAARWLVLAAGDPPVALAFEELDGHLRVPRDLIVEESTGHGPRGCLRGIVPLDGGARPIVDVPAVRAAIQALTGNSSGTGNGER
jgi:chemotaxis signal transduction protein